MDLDKIAREKISKELNKNIFVQASAGSGKTFSLVNRMVSMVESGIDVSEICTITFTKNAASEFFDRFQDLLSKRSFENPKTHSRGLNPQTKQTCEYCKKALLKIDQCFMGTIDSFTNLIASEHPNEVKIPAGTMVSSADDMNKQYERIYVDILKGKYGEELKNKMLVIRSFGNNSLKEFLAGMTIVMDKKDAKLVYNKTSSINLTKIKKGFIDGFIPVIDWLNSGLKLTKANTKLLEKINKSIDVVKRLSFDKCLDDAINILNIIQKFEFKKSDVKDVYNVSFIDVENPNGKAATKCKIDFDSIFKNEFVELQEYKYNSLMSILDLTREIVKDELRNSGMVTYSDYLLYLYEALKLDAANGGKLIKYISSKHKYYLIDESQDTSPIQTKLFFYLASDNPNPDWKLCIPRSGSLFIVGDDKQSIYGFRGADVNAYINTMEHFKNPEIGEVLMLKRNFRSSAKLRGWFNTAMKNVLKLSEGNSDHPDIPIDMEGSALEKIQNEEKATFNGIYKYEVVYDHQSVKKDDPIKVSSMINALVKNSRYTICAKQDDKPREITYSDFMVIDWQKSSLGNYLKSFRENNIPFFVEGNVPFEESEALNQIKILFKAICIPTNKKYIYHALKSPYINLTEEEMIKLRNAKFDFTITKSTLTDIDLMGLDNTIINKLCKLITLYNETVKLSFTAKFDYINNMIELYKLYSVENLEYAYYTSELLRTAEIEAKVITHEDAVNFINEINSDNKAYERALSLTKNQDRVHIANLHKVKGLQAPICILVGAVYLFPPNLRVEKSTDGSSGLKIFNISDSNTFTTYVSTNQFESERVLEQASKNAENARLEYVAVTRAEAALIMAEVTDKAHSPWENMLDNSPTLIVDKGVSNSKEVYLFRDSEIKMDNDLKTVSELYDSCENIINDLSLEKSYTIYRPSKEVVGRIDKENDENPDNAVTKTNVSDYSEYNRALLGTMIHRLMEALVNSKDKCDKDKLIELIVNQYNGLKYKEALIAVYDKIHTGGYIQDDGSYPDILDLLLSADEVMCEVPFAYKEDDKLYNGNLDVVYRLNDKWYIIDYKTTILDNIESLNEHYKNQLDLYKKALKATLGVDAEASIYHIDVK